MTSGPCGSPTSRYVRSRPSWVVNALAESSTTFAAHPPERNELKRDLAHVLAEHPCRPLLDFDLEECMTMIWTAPPVQPGAAAPPRPHPLALHRRHRRGVRRRRCRHPGTRGRQERRRAGHDVRRPDQDDDRAGHLLHDRAGHWLGAQSRHGRQGRRALVRLLPGDVDVRARDRPRRRQPDPPRQRHAPFRERGRQGRRARREGARIRRSHGLRRRASFRTHCSRR